MKALLVICLVALSLALTVRQDPVFAQYAFRIIVETESGDFVETLGVDSLRVTVSGVPARVEGLRSVDSGLTLALMVDVSHRATRSYYTGSRRLIGSDFPNLTRGIRREMSSHLRAGDRVRVARLHRRLEWGGGFETDAKAVDAAIERLLDLRDVSRIDQVGPVPVWDAVVEAATALATEGGGDVLLVTPGRATGNRLGVVDAAAELVRLGASAHVIYEDLQYMNFPPHVGDRLLRPLAELTGGVFRRDNRREAVAWSPVPPIADLFEGLRSRLEVRVSAPVETALRPLVVTSTQPDYRVHAPRWLRGTVTAP
jgi:hypothetical protein